MSTPLVFMLQMFSPKYDKIGREIPHYIKCPFKNKIRPETNFFFFFLKKTLHVPWPHDKNTLFSCREQIKIPYDKPYIYIEGEGKRRTRVIWDSHDSIATSATFISQAHNIVVKGITFIVSPKLNFIYI